MRFMMPQSQENCTRQTKHLANMQHDFAHGPSETIRFWPPNIHIQNMTAHFLALTSKIPEKKKKKKKKGALFFPPLFNGHEGLYSSL